MSSDSTHNDDFKKLFDSHQMPELPIDMEEKVMLGIEIQKLHEKRRSPVWFTKNLLIFSISLALLSLLSILQFTTGIQFAIFYDLQLLLLSLTAIFFGLWAIESVEGLLQKLFSRKVQSDFS